MLPMNILQQGDRLQKDQTALHVDSVQVDCTPSGRPEGFHITCIKLPQCVILHFWFMTTFLITFRERSVLWNPPA